MIAKNVVFILNLDRERKLTFTLESENHQAKVNFFSTLHNGCYIEVDSDAEQCVTDCANDAIHLELQSLGSTHSKLNINKPSYVGLRCANEDVEHDTLLTTSSASSSNDILEDDTVSILTHQDKCRTSGCLNHGSLSCKGLCRTCYQSWVDQGLIKDHFDFVDDDDPFKIPSTSETESSSKT